MLMYIVDQNVMRRQYLAEIIGSQPDAIFIVPDIALVEMSKSHEWESTMRSSFQALSVVVDRTFLCLSMGEILRIKMETQNSIDQATLIPDEFNHKIRQLIRDLLPNAESSTPFLDQMRATMEEAREEVVAENANPIATKNRVLKMVNSWADALSPRVIADLRNETINESMLLGFIKLNGDIFFRDMLKSEGIPDHEADVFHLKKPMFLRYFYLLVRHTLWWLKRSGLPSTRPEIALNHMLDQEYVALASYFDKLLTLDREALAAFQDLSVLLNDETMAEHEANTRDYLATLPHQ